MNRTTRLDDSTIAPDATKFTYQLLHHRRLPLVILLSAAVTVLAGTWLLVITSNGLDANLLFDASRLGYTIGGVAAILTFALGGLYVFPRTRTVERTIGQLLAAARPPTPEEQQLLLRTGAESRRAGWVVLTGLVIAVAAMATARLWPLIL